MPISQEQSYLSEIIDLNAPEIPPSRLGYFRERFRNRLHQLVLQKFRMLEDAPGFTKADLARRIGKRPEQVTRLFGAPGNWTLETVSDLLIGMGAELDISEASVLPLSERLEAYSEKWGTDDEVLSPESIEEMPVSQAAP